LRQKVPSQEGRSDVLNKSLSKYNCNNFQVDGRMV
jgi:hypothetical protein